MRIKTKYSVLIGLSTKEKQPSFRTQDRLVVCTYSTMPWLSDHSTSAIGDPSANKFISSDHHANVFHNNSDRVSSNISSLLHILSYVDLYKYINVITVEVNY